MQLSFEAFFDSHKSIDTGIDTIDILFESIDTKFFQYINTTSTN